MNFLIDIAPQIIKFPRSEQEKTAGAEKFEEIADFPGIIGAIDGSYIPKRTPADKVKSTYVNRHDQTALSLQGICDAEKKFIDVFTGISDKVHDSTLFKMSFIYYEIVAICGEKWHLIGDAAYGIRKWLLVPYRYYGNMSQEQKHFNKKLSQSRVKIENVFGLLKVRFRQLQKLDFLTVKKMSQFIMACYVLHNLCILNEDEWDDYIKVTMIKISILLMRMKILMKITKKHYEKLKGMKCVTNFQTLGKKF
ncbi:putative nuclease HARBI1 [Leptopilina boulardi]|uniref:putative nuclease HARBI1 n=1 Tax=Leptopilina boulardi TaxID=63433 RepID=UPI0021F5375C|nr:putative nuclease HARBI1 [Leptopilina boulardi]XP_051167342.1 putative nuclease HARBI1 [Leptopilina boulardi]